MCFECVVNKVDLCIVIYAYLSQATMGFLKTELNPSLVTQPTKEGRKGKKRTFWRSFENVEPISTVLKISL